MAQLTDVQIAGTRPKTEPYRLADGGSLFLEVRPTGTKLWRYRYRIAGKQNIFAIGRYFDGKKKPTDHVSLEMARTARDKARALVKQGLHPSHQRRTELLRLHDDAANTFEGVAREWIARSKEHWTPYYLGQVESMLGADVFPYVGALPIRSVTAAHLLAILRKVDARDAKTVAILIRQWCSAIFCYAVSTLRADSDPAAALKGVIKRNKVQHKRPLSRERIFDLLQIVDIRARRPTAIALRLLLLTFVRPGELRGARWEEFALDRAEWRIPAERMKMREMHIVPLAPQAVALLRQLQVLSGRSEFLFPNERRKGAVMTMTTLNRALERMGLAGEFSAHGFRATASTFLNEMNFREDLIERQLAHSERNKTRASYNQAQYLDERRAMMERWADFIESIESGANVIPIRKAAKSA